MANCLKAFIPQLCAKWQGLSDRRVSTETCCVSVFCGYTKSHLVLAILLDSWSTGPSSPANQIQTTWMCSWFLMTLLWRATMIGNDTELEVTLARIRRMQDQLALLRRTETNTTNYRLSSSGFIAEIDRMQLDVREYLSTPADLASVS